jgi:hypothetical protein
MDYELLRNVPNAAFPLRESLPGICSSLDIRLLKFKCSILNISHFFYEYHN